MIKKTLALAAVVLGLHAFAATPVAVWDGFTNLTHGDYTWVKAAGATVDAAGVLTIGSDGGLTMVQPSGIGNEVTFIADIEAYDPTGAQKTIFDIGLKNSSGNHVNLSNGSTSDAIVYNLWNANTGYGNVGTLSTGKVRIATTYKGAKDQGTHSYVIGGETAAGTGCYSSTDAIYSLGIGCYNSNERVATGMKVYRVAVFNTKLSADDVAAYQFPSEMTGETDGAVQTVAYWHNDFANGSTKGGYKMTLGTGTTVNADGTVTLTQQSGSGSKATKGVEISFTDDQGATAFPGYDMTVVVRYSGLSTGSSRYSLFATTWGTDNGEFVVERKSDGKLYYAMGVNDTDQPTDVAFSSTTTALPAKGLMLITMAGGGTANGTRVGFAPLNDDGTYGDFVDYGYASAATYPNVGFYGIKVGGTIGARGHFYRPGMKVEGVAIIKGFTTTMKTFRYLFPDECCRFDYASQNPTVETKYADGLKVRGITNGVFSAKVMAGSISWAGGMVCACQKAFTLTGDEVTKVALQYQVRESDYDKSADIYFTDKTDGIYFKKTGGHYNGISGDKLGTDDAKWAKSSGNYNFNNFSVYVPATKTATLAGGNLNWADILWTDGAPTAEDAVLLKVESETAITLDAASRMAGCRVISTAGSPLTITYAAGSADALKEKAWDFSFAAGGVMIDLSAVGFEIAKYAVTGAPYSFWLTKTTGGALTVRLPTVNGYTFATETVADYGTRVVVTAPTAAKNGAVSMNIHNGTALSGAGNHGLYPVALADWGNIQVANNATQTQDGLTFTLSSSVSGYGLNNDPPDMIQKQYMDDSATERTVTVSGMTAKGYSKYRMIVYFSTDNANTTFAAMSVTAAGSRVYYAGLSNTTTAGATVKGKLAGWGHTGASHNANPLGESVNALVTDVLTGDSVTLGFDKDDGGRATVAAIQVVKVGVVAKIGDTAYETLAAAEAAVNSGAGETIALTSATDEALTTAKTFTFDHNGFAYGGKLTVNGGTVTLSHVTTATFAGTIEIAAGGIVDFADFATDERKAMDRALLDKTTGDGTIKIPVDAEYDIHNPGNTPLTANVNVDFTGTGTLKFVGETKDTDCFTVSSGKTVTFNEGTLWAQRNTFHVYGNMFAKNVDIGHNSTGNYPGKVYVYDGGVVKAEAVTFRNPGSGSNSILEVRTGGVLEITQDAAAGITKTLGAKYTVNLAGGTLKADASSWYSDASISMTLANNTTTTLSAAEGKTIDLRGVLSGTGNIAVTGAGIVKLSGANTDTGTYTVAEGATLDLSATHPYTSKIAGASAGTVSVVLTDDEKTSLESGESISPITIDGEYAGNLTVKAYDGQGTSYEVDFEYSEGKIVITKKKGARMSPFNVTNPTTGDWTAAGWMDSTTPTALAVLPENWENKVNANIAVESAQEKTLTADRALTLGTLAITNAGTLAISTNGTYAITLDALDDSASTGTTTIGFDTGAAPIAAGANTILNGTGTGKITMAANTKVTVGNNHFGGDFTVTDGIQIYAPDATSEMIFGLGEGNTQGILGNSKIANSQFAMTVTSGILDFKTSCNGSGYGVFNKRTMTADGATAVLKLSAADVTGSSGGGVAINLLNGGTLEVAKRDTMKLPVNLMGGTVKLLTGCTANNRALDLYGNNDWHVIAADGATAQNPTVSAITYEDGAADDDKKVMLRNEAWNVNVDENARFDVYANIVNKGTASGTPGKLVKAGAGKLVLKADGTYDQGTEVQAGTLTLEAPAAMGTGAATVASGTTIELNAPQDANYTLANAISGDGRVFLVGAGTWTLTGANDYTGGTTVEAGKLVVDSNFTGNYVINANGSAEFTADTTVDGYATPTVTTLNGTLVLNAKTTTVKAMSGASFAIATLPVGVDPAKVTATLIDKESGATIATDVTIDPTTGAVTVKVHIEDYTLTPTSSGDFTWAVGEAGSSFDASKKWTDFGNVGFKTTAYTTTVTNPALVKASNVQLGGTYSFDGSPMVASKLATVEGAAASFANDAVATDAAITNGAVAFASLTANDVVVSNATFDAKVLGPSMKFVRLKITQTSGGASDNRPAVGEFRLYRGSATTGYTIVDWPVGTKVSDSTGLVATKETADYPAEVGAGLGQQGGNECQPGDLIDGYYGSDNKTPIYGGGTYRTPHYNKWWPDTQKDGGPWIVTIEFPYPVATFSGCNFCLADHAPRNPTAWTIEVSDDGETWVEVNNTTGATWGDQYDWAGEGENVPAFLNKGTTPTEVNVQNGATVVADGSWTAALNASGNITFLGVAGKNLTLDAASTSSFAEGAKLKFDLNAYDVSAAGKQYVVAGPTKGWPEVADITVEPKTFSLYKDAEGYYVVVESGNYWVGDQEGGVGTWDFRNTKAWATNATETTKKDIWLNDVPAFFTRNGEVTIAASADIQPTAINITSNNDIAVTFKGAVGKIASMPFNIGSTNVTVTVENDEALTFGSAMTAVAGSAPKFVKTGTGDLTLNTAAFTSVTAEAGTLKQGSDERFGANAMITASGSGVLDLNGYRPRAIVTLGAGGTLVNNRASLASNKEQCTNIVLTGNATVGGTKDFGLIANSYNATTLTLGDNTLTKTGANNFWLCNTTITGAGTIQIDDGTLAVSDNGSKARTTTFADGTISIGAAGTLLVAANRTLTVGAIAGAAGGTLNNAGTISAFTLTGVLTVGNTGTYGTITLSSAVFDIGPRRGLTLAGAGSVKAQLTAAYNPGDKVTLFTAAQDSDIALTELKDASGDIIDSSRYTFANGEVTFRKEAKIGTTYYIVLADAVSAAKDGDVVELLADANVGTTAIPVAGNIALAGDSFAVTGAGFSIDAEKTLTISNGFFGVSTDIGSGTLQLKGGRYTAACKTAWAEGKVPSGYVFAELAVPVGDYAWQVLASAEPIPDTKAVVPVANPDGTDAGSMVLDKEWVAEKGSGNTVEEKVADLNTPQSNGQTKLTNEILGLDGAVAESKPVPAPQQVADANHLAFKLGGCDVDTDSGATVTFKVLSADTPGASSWTAASDETAYDGTATVALPDSGVKYYKFEVVTLTSK